MTHTLVTFLGRPQVQDGRYREATYRFPEPGPDGETDRKEAFFGLALAKHLEPTQVVILGTSGSMWGVLVSDLWDGPVSDLAASPGTDNGDMNKILALLDAEEKGEVTDSHLDDDMASIMKCAIGREVKPRLIPYGKDDAEQYDILQAVSDAVPEGGHVSFDLTHGFRHLGMVGFLSAFMLERVRSLDVCGLWYGALDMTSKGITPVLELGGLDRVRRWVDALNRFDASGDYGVFAPLLIADNVPEDKAQCLERAAFHERTLNLSSATEQIRTFLPILDNLDKPLTGASGLFRKRLRDRLAWVQQRDLAQRQSKLAFVYLERSDFIRAAMFGWEALATQECSRRPEYCTSNFEHRKEAIESLENDLKQKPRRRDCRRNAFFTLRSIRNALAHGNPPQNQHIQHTLKDAGKLKEEMSRAFRLLLNATSGCGDHR